jgi:hypothetical protein
MVPLSKKCIGKKALLNQDHVRQLLTLIPFFTIIKNDIVPMLTSLPLINSLVEKTKYMKKGGKRFMWPD